MNGTAEEQVDDDIRAGEYVLGLLEPLQARALEAEAVNRAELAAAIIYWENRLRPLQQVIKPVAPPADLWNRIAAKAFGKPAQRVKSHTAPRPLRQGPGPWRSLPLWRAATAGFALAASIAGMALLQQPEPPTLIAALLPPGQVGPVIIAQRLESGRVAIRPIGKVAADSQHDLELWALAAGATKPISLGVMPSRGVILAANKFPPSGQILVSLEPLGGSKTGLPTGPVVSGGSITQKER